VNSKDENSKDFCLDFIQEFVIWMLLTSPSICHPAIAVLPYCRSPVFFLSCYTCCILLPTLLLLCSSPFAFALLYPVFLSCHPAVATPFILPFCCCVFTVCFYWLCCGFYCYPSCLFLAMCYAVLWRPS
jgi:hypothetical protein